MTPDAQRSSSRITLLTRPGCSLCAAARDTVARVATDTGVGWRELDVDADAELADTFGERVPVVLIDGEEHGYWRVEEERLRAALEGRRVY